jgi:hypothetical protein
LRDLYNFMTNNPSPLLESQSNFDNGTLNVDLLDNYEKISSWILLSASIVEVNKFHFL